MPIKVKLGFGGLCLFVPEYDDEQNLISMHVLLPQSHGHKHECKLMWGKGPVKSERTLDLANLHLDLTGLKSTTSLTHIQSGLADLAKSCSVSRKLLTDPGNESKLSARIRFSAGTGSISPCGKGAEWTVGGTSPMTLAIRVEWDLEVESTSVVVKRFDLKSGNPLEDLELEPAGGVLEAWIFHAPEDQLPKELPPQTRENASTRTGDDARHFHLFQGVLNCTAGGLKVPKFHAHTAPGPDESTCMEKFWFFVDLVAT